MFFLSQSEAMVPRIVPTARPAGFSGSNRAASWDTNRDVLL